MSDHDAQLLVIGISVGINLMLFVQFVFGFLDDRRDRKAERAAQALLDAARGRADA